jgi:hypothetical protein
MRLPRDAKVPGDQALCWLIELLFYNARSFVMSVPILLSTVLSWSFDVIIKNLAVPLAQFLIIIEFDFVMKLRRIQVKGQQETEHPGEVHCVV